MSGEGKLSIVFAQTIGSTSWSGVESTTAAHIRFDYALALSFVKIVRNGVPHPNLAGCVASQKKKGKKKKKKVA